MKIKKILFIGTLSLFSSTILAQDSLPQLFLFLGGEEASLYKAMLNNNCVNGVQIIYSWKQLEPKKDLEFLNKEHKKLSQYCRLFRRYYS